MCGETWPTTQMMWAMEQIVKVLARVIGPEPGAGDSGILFNLGTSPMGQKKSFMGF